MDTDMLAEHNIQEQVKALWHSANTRNGTFPISLCGGTGTVKRSSHVSSNEPKQVVAANTEC
jgi:hypothetical protein